MTSQQLYEQDLAYIHQAGFGELSRRAGEWILSTLDRTGIHGGTVVELGCGSGSFLATLLQAGYNAVGNDISAAMLELAAACAPGATLIESSLYDARIPPCDAVVAIGEGLNYVDGPESVPPTRQLFDRVAQALPPGGLFTFDVIVRGRSVPRGYRSWGAGPDWACLVEVAPHENGEALRRGITTFRLVDGAYRRGAEDHWVHLFSVGALRQELMDAGFHVRTAFRYGSYRLPPGRRLFHCTRGGA